jgi:hypothetical protein
MHPKPDSGAGKACPFNCIRDYFRGKQGKGLKVDINFKEVLIREFDDYTSRIENDPTNRKHYVNIYNAILKSLPHLSDKKESGLPDHRVTGNLRESYRINYSSYLGYRHMAVTVISGVDRNPLVRTDIVRAVFGVQLPFDTISNIDTRNGLMTTIHQNIPF